MYDCFITDIALSENVLVDVRVYFTLVSPGYRGDRTDPGVGPEFEVEEVEVIAVHGETWTKSGDELEESGWYDVVHRAADRSAVLYDELYEHQVDAFDSWEPDYD